MAKPTMIRITKAYLVNRTSVSPFVAIEFDFDFDKSPRGSGKWVMRLEDGRGYIFREYPSYGWGYNGWNISAINLVRDALSISAPNAIYSFQRQEELDAWLALP